MKQNKLIESSQKKFFEEKEEKKIGVCQFVLLAENVFQFGIPMPCCHYLFTIYIFSSKLKEMTFAAETSLIFNVSLFFLIKYIFKQYDIFIDIKRFRHIFMGGFKIQLYFYVFLES